MFDKAVVGLEVLVGHSLRKSKHQGLRNPNALNILWIRVNEIDSITIQS